MSSLIFDLLQTRSGVLKVVISVLVGIQVICVVNASISKWGKHPQRIKCTLSADACTAESYAYERTFCFWELFRTRHNNAIHGYCKLPKTKLSEKPLPKLSEIETAEIKDNGKYSDFYIVTKDGERVLAASKIESGFKTIKAVNDFQKGLGWCNSEQETLTGDKEISVWVE